MATQNMQVKAPLGDPKQYKNMGHGPLSLDAPSYGSMSIPGKGKVWLWPQDVVQRSIRHAMSQGILIEWDDGSVAPGKPVIPAPPAPSSSLLRRQRRLKVEEDGHQKDPRRRTERIGDVLEEDPKIQSGRPTVPVAVVAMSGAELEKAAAAKAAQVSEVSESAEDEDWKKDGAGSGPAGRTAPRARGSAFKKNDKVSDKEQKANGG